MSRYLLRRLSHSLAVLWVVATLTFVLMRVTPGGPFDREQRLPPQVLANIAAKYHLDEPLISQYLRYMTGLIQGDLGPSYKYLDRTVREIIISTLPVSALLGILALAFAVIVSFPAGLLAAYYHNSWTDRWCLFLATLGISLPNFILGGLLIWIFSLQLGWFQAGRWGTLSSIVLPTITLGSSAAAYLTYLLRSTLIETLGADFIRTARAKGLKEIVVIFKHAMRNSISPLLTVLGPLLAALVTGSFVVEYVFAIPGMGRFFITAVTDRDYPMIMGVTLVYSTLLVSANLIVDLLYSVIDPRVKRH
ncbi:MAG: ABC transporter permease [Deltaproteobacteria bacterium]|nr:ABC transporter permease [Deltaproteobacteria bacterium]MCZ6563749.1 ABC transporter permease [Deltaproteobacteria bacterium]